MTTLAPDSGPRTYVAGGRRPRRGLTQNLGEAGTALFFGGLFLVIPALVLGGFLAAIGWLAVWALLLFGLTRRDEHNRSVAQRIGERLGWAWKKQKKAHVLTQGPFGQVLYGRYQLPGLHAASELEDWEDGFRRRVGLLHVPADNSYVVVFSCDPDGGNLLDQEVVDQRVRRYGLWLGRLGGIRHLLCASVTFETVEDDGLGLAREVEAHHDETAGDIPSAMLAEIVQTYPANSHPRSRAWVALTFTGAGRKKDEVIKDLRSRIPGLMTALAGTGAGAVRPASAARLCEMVRGAYDPQAVQRLEAARMKGAPVPLTWEQAGPSHADERPKSYVTDGGTEHVTWAVSNVPRGEVQEDNLVPLLEPNPLVPRKRVTIKYHPMNPGQTARTVDADARTASSHAKRTPNDERAQAVHEAAKRTAQEEARGAGLVDYSVLITATVTDPVQLDDTVATVENLAAACRLDVRRPHGGQAVAFAAALPLGLVTPRHQRMPAELTS